MRRYTSRTDSAQNPGICTPHGIVRIRLLTSHVRWRRLRMRQQLSLRPRVAARHLDCQFEIHHPLRGRKQTDTVEKTPGVYCQEQAFLRDVFGRHGSRFSARCSVLNTSTFEHKSSILKTNGIELPNLTYDLPCPLLVNLSIYLRGHCRGMPQDNTGRLDAVRRPNPRSSIVP